MKVKLSVMLCLLFFTLRAEAEPGGVHSFGLLVGSNLPGNNQEKLRFAHRDAERVREVLSEIGDYDSNNMVVLSDPDGNTVRKALEQIKGTLEEYHRRDEQTSFLFYYSGHARAHALCLGKDELPLDEVRKTLEDLPATVKIVILDACQSGAFSRVKGAESAAGFSYNSVSMLNTSGMAVMASGTASELSQESEKLEGSYFTHYLTVGLRGAADGDMNGQVTLYEAYRYAYNQTLTATTGTAVGKQHVTLETEMRGKGEVVLTKPAEASARLLLPSDLKAEILIYRSADRTVAAELHKAGGLEMGLAFPPDDYDVLVRPKETARRCSVRLVADRVETLDVSRCAVLKEEKTAVKRGDEEPLKAKNPFKWLPFVEFSAGGLLTDKEDAFTRRLDTFEFEPKTDRSRIDFYYDVFVGVHLNRYLSFGATYSSLEQADADEYVHRWYYVKYDDDIHKERKFGWRAHRFALKVRGTYPLLGDRLIPFVQISAGGSAAKTRLQGDPDDIIYFEDTEEIHWGYSLSAGAGVIGMVYRSVGLLFQLEYVFAPAISNLYDEHRNSGGLAFSGGVRLTL